MEVCFQTAKLPCCRHPQHPDRRRYSYGPDPHALAAEDALEEEDHYRSRFVVGIVRHCRRHHPRCPVS